MPNIERQVINLVGLKGSGKSQAATYLRDNYGFAVFRPLDIVNTHYQSLSDSPESQNYHQRRLLETHPAALTRPILQSTGRVCIDSLLVPRQAAILQDMLGDDYATFAFECHSELRAKHLREAKYPSDYERGISTGQLRIDEAYAYAGEGPFDCNVQEVMDMCEQRGALINANKPLLSVRLQLKHSLGQLGITGPPTESP